MTKFNGKTRRGLALMRGLLIDALTPGGISAHKTVRTWPRAQQRDFNQAMTWLEELEEREALRATAAAEREPEPVAAGGPLLPGVES